MTFSPVPWSIDGARVPAALARRMAYAATQGGEGIVLPEDLQVKALTAPGNAVTIFPGGASLLNRYLGPLGGGQTYMVDNASGTQVTVVATGTSAATKWIVVRIDDPEYPNQQAPASVLEGPYVRPITLTSDPTVNPPAYPHIVLARINQPANTAAITQEMITDLRQIAQPKTDMDMAIRPTVTSDPAAGMLLTVTHVDGEWFPNAGGEQYFDIPWWANQMHIEAEWLGVLYGPENAVGWGDMWVDYGAPGAPGVQKLANSTAKFRWDAPRGDYNRANWKVAQSVTVPKNMRGKKRQQFIMKARRDGGTITCKMDHRSGITLKVTYLQVPEVSDS